MRQERARRRGAEAEASFRCSSRAPWYLQLSIGLRVVGSPYGWTSTSVFGFYDGLAPVLLQDVGLTASTWHLMDERIKEAKGTMEAIQFENTQE